MIGKCKSCHSENFTLDLDEDGDWRIRCSNCGVEVFDSHSNPYPDVEMNEE